MIPRRALAFAIVALGAAAIVPACSLGEGEGSILGVLNVPDCWAGHFELHPDFFAGVPYRTSLDLRIQSGGDYETFSDGISVEIEDNAKMQAQIGNAVTVSLPPEVTPPGVPVKAIPDPAPVHLALYLQRTCPTQNVALYALDAVTLDGTNCDVSDCAFQGDAGGAPADSDAGADATLADADASFPPPDASFDAAGADGGDGGDGGSAPAPGTGRVGRSTITFSALFDGVPDESSAAKRLTQATFDVYLADPRQLAPGGIGPPPPCLGHICGSFKFYFQRGRPAQPFP